MAFQTLSEIAIIGQLADNALRQVLPDNFIAGFGVLNRRRLGVDGEPDKARPRLFRSPRAR